MQTIIATVKQQDKNTYIQIGDKVIASIIPSVAFPGRYQAGFCQGGVCNNARYVDAVEFITTLIERFFLDRFGLEIKFE